MGVQSLTGGNATNRVGVPTTEDEQQRRDDRNDSARNVVSAIAANQHPGSRDGDPENPSPELLAAARYRAELYAALGLDGGTR